jgi:alpha-glucosidase
LGGGTRWCTRRTRSLQDSGGDGVGDPEGIRSRLPHLVDLGVDALWLSPVNPSPMADGGYDVSDYEDIDPQFRSLATFDALLKDVHAHGLKLLLDIVPCRTSSERPWFLERPDFYVWLDRDGPRNSWRSTSVGLLGIWRRRPRWPAAPPRLPTSTPPTRTPRGSDSRPATPPS